MKVDMRRTGSVARNILLHFGKDPGYSKKYLVYISSPKKLEYDFSKNILDVLYSQFSLQCQKVILGVDR